MSRIGPDHEQWADSVGAYLLEALPEGERADFERHLAGCELCRDDVADLQVAADALPASVEQLAPPPELKARIMAVVQAEAELLAAAAGPRADLPERAPRRRRFAGLSLRPLAGLAVAGVLALGVVVGVALDDGGSGRTVSAQVDKISASGARAQLEIRDRDSRLVVAGLPAPPKDRVYQVWLKRDGEAAEPTSSLFTPRADGSGSVSVPGSLKGVDQVLVTDEPAGGSQVPTRQPVITAAIS
jgi:anti-sigma-K factor RskA